MVMQQIKISLPHREHCRTCGAQIVEFLNFGFMPLAGAFFTPGESEIERLYPMAVAFCPNCTLVQIPNVVPKEVLFNENYRYFSSVTSTLNAHFDSYAAFLKHLTRDYSNPVILEFGCNDGVLLSRLQRDGVRCFGIDASLNVVEAGRQRGLDITCGFFNPALASQMLETHPRPNVITGSNVFAHNDDVTEILDAVNLLLDQDGYFIVEVHYVADLLKGMQFDFFYHEHCRYYSLTSISRLLLQNGLTVVDVERVDLHGGVLRVLSKKSDSAGQVAPSVSAMLENERVMGLHSIATYEAFAERVQGFRTDMVNLLAKYRSEGRKVCAYGASGRAVTLLNFVGPLAKTVGFFLDDSPARYGRLMPGLQTQILKPERALLEATDVCLITAWPYAAEIMRKEAWYLEAGKAFVIPLPKVTVMER